MRNHVFSDAAALTLLTGLLVASGPALAGPEPWSALQRVGGLSIGPPFSSPDGWLLVVRANLRSRAVAATPSAPDASPSCRSTRAVVEGGSIYLTVISGPPGSRVASVCPAARLGRLESGTYKVFYRGPDEPAIPLGEVTIGS